MTAVEAPICRVCGAKHWLREPHQFADDDGGRRTIHAAPVTRNVTPVTKGVTPAKAQVTKNVTCDDQCWQLKAIAAGWKPPARTDAERKRDQRDRRRSEQ